MNLPLLLPLTLTFVFAGKAQDSFRDANNLFAQTFYKQLSQTQEGNILVSPFSTANILAILLISSKGESAKELRTILNLSLNEKQVEDSLESLLLELRSGNSFLLRIINQVYLEGLKGHSLVEKFIEPGVPFYGAETHAICYLNATEAQEHTDDKFDDLPETFSRQIPANALFFAAAWAVPFSKQVTFKSPFHVTSRHASQVDTMHRRDLFNYTESPATKAELLELPFNGQASMVIVLPNNDTDLAFVENNLDLVFAEQSRLQKHDIAVAIPKFRIQAFIHMEELLTKLGVQKIFGLGGVAGVLYVDKIHQKTFIDVDENGIEAAASTGLSKSVLPKPEKLFVVDRPFIFFIKVKDVVFYIGRVVDPLKS